jgi:hypothetical protein
MNLKRLTIYLISFGVLSSALSIVCGARRAGVCEQSLLSQSCSDQPYSSDWTSRTVHSKHAAGKLTMASMNQGDSRDQAPRHGGLLISHGVPMHPDSKELSR